MTGFPGTWAAVELLTENPLLQSPVFSNSPLQESLKAAILEHLWPLPAGLAPQQIVTDQFSTYFTHFEQECSPSLSSYHSIRSFSDTFTILAIIRANPTLSLADLLTIIRATNPALAADEDKLLASIEFTVRLWLMVNVRTTMPAQRHVLALCFPWPKTQSLVDISTAERFSDSLNVVDMRKIANIRVLWTNDLAEHLTMRGKFLYLFSQVAVLKRIRMSGTSNNLLPPGLLDETVETLNLLIPQGNPPCNVWISKEVSRLGLDPQLQYRTTTNRSTRAYSYWQGRLLDLSDAFDKTKPTGPIQWWHDRRDMGQWWNYWLVVVGITLTLLFGLIQSITGILQVVGAGGGKN
ncbi:uncharacterized protein C8A04DRAFT_40552 [Dichotomopilus funicola]|uniref:Uncharacterized protein n=1 Tax=Dichotomopilus funicola TaxID=1934379 RepID=A0AAN6ZJA2_9PEZI|nr:hypothetical protein C8A04DRAFT_40552 [Dichotomopilus funicola]